MIFLFVLNSLYADAMQPANSSIKELHKKSHYGFVVPHVLRYDPDKWLMENNDLRWAGGYGLKVKIYESKEKLNYEQEDAEFQKSIKKRCADPLFYTGVEFILSEIVVINEISFLHQKAIMNLAPNSKHHRKEGKTEYLRRIGEKGAQDQLDFYVCYSEKGEVILCIDSTHIISSEEQQEIDELLRGFSFDGSACRGPKGLRILKNTLEMLTNQ